MEADDVACSPQVNLYQKVSRWQAFEDEKNPPVTETDEGNLPDKDVLAAQVAPLTDHASAIACRCATFRWAHDMRC